MDAEKAREENAAADRRDAVMLPRAVQAGGVAGPFGDEISANMDRLDYLTMLAESRILDVALIR